MILGDFQHQAIGGPRVTAGDGGGLQGTAGDSKMVNVRNFSRGHEALVLDGELQGKLEKGPGGTTKCRPSSSWPRTDGMLVANTD